MSNHKYNLELTIGLEDFQNSNYEEIIKTSKREDYTAYWTVLSTEAKKEIELGNEKKGKVLWLLSDICSLMLNPKSLQEPYSPYIVMVNGGKSVDSKDFTDNDIKFFEDIVDECNDFRLQARIADILWLIKKKKNIKHLELAVENYMKFPMDIDNFHKDSDKCIERAIRLIILSKRPIDNIQKFLLQVFTDSKLEDNFHCTHINDLLLIAKINIEDNLEVIEKLESFAEEFEIKGDHWRAREYNQSARTWFTRTNNTQNINRLTVKIAENFVGEANSRKDSQMVAAKFYENAIQEYRLVPTKDRAEYNVEDRLHEIYQLMVQSNQLATGELQLMQTDPIDISELISGAITRIKNKDIDKAIVSLANISRNSDFKRLKQSAEKHLGSSLSRLFGATYYSADSRVIAKTNGGLEQSGEDYELQLEAQIQQEYSIDIDLSIQGSIYPAFEQFLLEHTISKEYIISICLNSSIVPRDRAMLWAEGLYFGFENNFLVTTHLLIPQIEHLIRVLLKQAGVKTSVLEPTGIEMEKGLSTLIDEPKLEELISKNMIYEFKSLLTKSIGYNLRNNIAHGLSSYNTFFSAQAIYLWWFVLKLVVNNGHLIKTINEIKSEDKEES